MCLEERERPVTTETALLRAVCEQPEDDGVRLIYADWLEDHGLAERAELIRVGLERSWTPGSVGPDTGLVNPAWLNLFKKEQALVSVLVSKSGQPSWPAINQLLVGLARYRQCAVDHPERPGRLLVANAAGELADALKVSRGFVEEVKCTMADWLEHGPAAVLPPWSR